MTSLRAVFYTVRQSMNICAGTVTFSAIRNRFPDIKFYEFIVILYHIIRYEILHVIFSNFIDAL